METHAHTPGPWTVFEDSRDARPGIEADAFSVVIYGYGDDDDGGVQGKSKEEEMANAYLIAAAPDLLEAAQQAIQVFINQGWDDDLIAAKTLKAAIAKAINQN